MIKKLLSFIAMTMIMTCTAMAYGQQKSNENHGNAAFQHTMPDDKRLTGVVLETIVGGKRNLHKPIGDPVPRIC